MNLATQLILINEYQLNSHNPVLVEALEAVIQGDETADQLSAVVEMLSTTVKTHDMMSQLGEDFSIMDKRRAENAQIALNELIKAPLRVH
jgi:hypothetical protein